MIVNNLEPKPAKPPLGRTLLRGLRRRCPNCGEGRIFQRYIKPNQCCAHCAEPLGHIRTDDFAPWLTIIVLGHIILPLLLHVEMAYHPPASWQIAFWIPITTALALLLLPVSKGVCLSLMWALRLTGDEQH